MFDVKRRGYIDFGDFVRSLNFFHPNAPQEDKIDCKLNGCESFVLEQRLVTFIMHTLVDFFGGVNSS